MQNSLSCSIDEKLKVNLLFKCFDAVSRDLAYDLLINKFGEPIVNLENLILYELNNILYTKTAP